MSAITSLTLGILSFNILYFTRFLEISKATYLKTPLVCESGSLLVTLSLFFEIKCHAFSVDLTKELVF